MVAPVQPGRRSPGLGLTAALGPPTGGARLALTGGGPATAIEAAMLRAGAAGRPQPTVERLARTKEANRSIVGRDASFLREVLNRLAFDVDLFQHLRVLRLERVREIEDALAELA